MKSARQEKILELIRAREIDTQAELASALEAEGFPVTQATVSRDIRDLKLTKVAGQGGRARYAALEGARPLEQDRYARVLQDAVVSAVVGQNLVVIHTDPGIAMGAAAALDAMGWPELLGCIAGDDTIFCACQGPQEAAALADRIRRLL